MAEGDVIHRVAARIGAAMAGEKISEARAPSPRSPLHRHAQRLQALTLEVAEARGKHLLIGFADGLWLRSHLKMNGSWHLYARGERWRRPERRAWLVLGTAAHEAVQFDGPELELLPAARVAIHPRLARLGPDLLGEEFDAGEAVASLRRSDPTRELGDALLDQTLVSGIGNIFKSEGLHRARLDPWRRIGDLSDAELTAAVSETAEMMATSLRSGRRPHAVYRASGRPCPRCRNLIRSRGQGDDNRATYWCPVCQE